jgi:DNA-binding transcriptional regulator LsrR (DeoR family)
MSKHEKINLAVKVARMYYYQNMQTKEIAEEIHTSRSTVSRLLSFAKNEGLVNIQILDPSEEPRLLEKQIIDKYHLAQVYVIPVPEIAGEAEWLNRTAQFTAKYLNTRFDSNMIMGIAWGTTLSAISSHLVPKQTHHSQIVQLNGTGNTQSMGIEYASEILMRFAQNYNAQAHLFPVPTFFDYAETKNALWRERSIKRILDLQDKADLLIYSIGAVNARVPSHVYSGGYLDDDDYAHLEEHNIVGDIATHFFKEDGRYSGIPINERASGPNPGLFRRKYGICIVSGLAKVPGLNAALKGSFMKELIVDEPTARALINRYLYEE